ncbi:hypothetical protein [Nocardioides sp. URHA0020]|uniref:hypothetical protein n=1 Tax=Nocardioides sp. URHA0020 TaxID=1380392 RepID=UPI00048AAA6B|nr:hypothetical protein [Nocardioides sp. URHA0020]
MDELKLAELRRDGLILGVESTDGDHRYSVAQFERAGDLTRVRPGLQSLFRALRKHEAWTVAVLMHTPAPELGDLTPLQWVRAGGDRARLDAYARLVSNELSRPKA